MQHELGDFGGGRYQRGPPRGQAQCFKSFTSGECVRTKRRNAMFFVKGLLLAGLASLFLSVPAGDPTPRQAAESTMLAAPGEPMAASNIDELCCAMGMECCATSPSR